MTVSWRADFGGSFKHLTNLPPNLEKLAKSEASAHFLDRSLRLFGGARADRHRVAGFRQPPGDALAQMSRPADYRDGRHDRCSP